MKQINFIQSLLFAALICLTTTVSGQNYHPLEFGATAASTTTNWYKDYVGLKFEVTAPTVIAGYKAYTATNDGLGTASDWGGLAVAPIVNVPVIMGPSTDSFGCTAFTAGSMTGKIALIWRGPIGGASCEFSAKALAAQNAGAVACVLINEYPGQGPVGMAAGTSGGSVTIPVFMIGYNDGVAISAQYHALPAGSVTMTITQWGTGLVNDLGLVPEGNAGWHAHAVPANQLTGTSPFPYRALDGAFVANFGLSRATHVKVTGALNFTPSGSSTATTVHRDTTEVLASFPPYDSIYAMFVPGLYSITAIGTGRFDLTYNIMSDSVDGNPADNTITDTFYASDSVYSKGRYNFAGNVPEIYSYSGLEAGGVTYDFLWGPMYYIAHGKAAISSVQFSLSGGPSPYFGSTPINVYAFKWVDGSGGEPLDSIVQNGELLPVSVGVYTFSATDSSGVIFKVQMGDPVTGVPGPPILLDTNAWYYIAVDVPNGYGLGCDGQLSSYPRVYGRYHNSGTLDYAGIMWPGDYSGGTNPLTAALGGSNAPVPFPGAYYI